MLIISKFRDYYDSALAGGVDKNIVYRRKQRKVETFPKYLETKGSQRDLTRVHRGTTYTIQTRQFAVAFCGKIHFGIRVEKPNRTWESNNFDYCYNLEQYTKATAGYKPEKYYGFRKWKTNTYKVTEEYFRTEDETRLAEDKIIVAYSMPDKYGRLENITIDVNLSSIKFYRVVDSYAALQEIMMYISGVIGVGEKDTIKISDEDMRDAKGFNKGSFKNPIRVRDLK